MIFQTVERQRPNRYVEYRIGKMYAGGLGIQRDESARYFLDHMNDSPSLFASATRLLHHMGRMFQEQAPPPSGGISFVDSKLRRKIREKKIAMGHKPDDHEEPVQQLR